MGGRWRVRGKLQVMCTRRTRTLQFWHEATPDHQLGAYRTKDGAPNRTAPGTVPHKKQFLAEQMVSLTVAVAASHGAKFAAIYISKKIVFLLHYIIIAPCRAHL